MSSKSVSATKEAISSGSLNVLGRPVLRALLSSHAEFGPLWKNEKNESSSTGTSMTSEADATAEDEVGPGVPAPDFLWTLQCTLHGTRITLDHISLFASQGRLIYFERDAPLEDFNEEFWSELGLFLVEEGRKDRFFIEAIPGAVYNFTPSEP